MTNSKNLRYCNILHAGISYDVMVGVGDLDELDNILQDWALSKGITLNLPQDLIANQAITEVLTTLNIDEFVYIESPVSAYMEKQRYAGVSGTFPLLPTALVGGFYIVPTCLAFLWSEAGNDGYFGEYVIPESDPYTLTAGINYIGISFNTGAPAYTMHTNFSDFDFSSVIPVVTVLNFGSKFMSIPFGQCGYGLPEKKLSLEVEKDPLTVMSAYTLTSPASNYVSLSAVSVRSGVKEVVCPAVLTSSVANDMYLHYKDSSSVWQNTKVTQLNNTQCQTASSGLASLNSGEFVINNIFRVVDGTVSMIFNVLSDRFSTLQDAMNSSDIVDVPPMFKGSAVHIGRMIVEINSTVPAVQKLNNRPWGLV